MLLLVTGGAGFIGSHVVDVALSRGHDVCVIDNLSTGDPRNLPRGTRLFTEDILRPQAAAIVKSLKPDAILHLAAQASVSVSMRAPELDCQVNVLGTLRMLGAAAEAGCRGFVFASSAAVYGDPLSIPIGEDHPINPQSFYAASKASAERYVTLYASKAALNAHILRYANVYGPRQDPYGEAGVVAKFVDAVRRGVEPVIHGTGEQTRDFVYVRDVAEATVVAAEALVDVGGGQDGRTGVFNIGTGKPTSIVELLDAVCRAAGRTASPRFEERRPGDIDRSALDPSAAGRGLGWTPSFGLEQGIREMLLSFGEEGPRDE